MRLSTLSAIGAALLHSTAFAAGIETRPVSFQNEGVTLAGTLYLPADYKPGEKRPGVLVTGAWTSIKEQMSGLYAEEMAEPRLHCPRLRFPRLGPVRRQYPFQGGSGGQDR
ncbi:alpha/beta hydrolase [Rhizobium laguerreae]